MIFNHYHRTLLFGFFLTFWQCIVSETFCQFYQVWNFSRHFCSTSSFPNDLMRSRSSSSCSSRAKTLASASLSSTENYPEMILKVKSANSWHWQLIINTGVDNLLKDNLKRLFTFAIYKICFVSSYEQRIYYYKILW